MLLQIQACPQIALASTGPVHAHVLRADSKMSGRQGQGIRTAQLADSPCVCSLRLSLEHRPLLPFRVSFTPRKSERETETETLTHEKYPKSTARSTAGAVRRLSRRGRLSGRGDTGTTQALDKRKLFQKIKCHTATKLQLQKSGGKGDSMETGSRHVGHTRVERASSF